MERHRIVIKKFLSLVTNSQKVNIKLVFWGDNMGPKSPNLMNSTTVLCGTIISYGKKADKFYAPRCIFVGLTATI